MTDPLYAVRSYDCSLSRQARDNWLSFRESQGNPVRQSTGKFDSPPSLFMQQWAAMRARKG